MMKINYLSEVHQGNWTQIYHSTVIRALEEFDVVTISAAGLTDEEVFRAVEAARPCDVWYCSSFLDRWLRPVSMRADVRAEKIIVHNHGGMETHDSIALELGTFDTLILPMIASDSTTRVLFNTESNRKDFSDYYGVHVGSLRVVGFPILSFMNDDNVDGGTQRGGIVVPGRFSETKQTLLAAEILLPYLNRGVVFSTGVMPNRSYASILRTLGYRVSFVQGSKYHRLIRQARVAFTATMADAICVSMAECASAGAILVAPNRGPFVEYVNPNFLYEPFSIKDARDKVDLALEADLAESQSRVDQYSLAAVASRIRAVVHEFSRVL